MSLPRMRGDPPVRASLDRQNAGSTPHARGSTAYQLSELFGSVVYPACAGIHPHVRQLILQPKRLPRMRGDPPHISVRVDCIAESTPHARGSTLAVCIPKHDEIVYPACAGIHPFLPL